MSNSKKLGAAALATIVLGLAACGDDDRSETTAAKPSPAAAQPAALNLDHLLMMKDEQPGFSQGAAPGAMPESRGTITGVDAYVNDMGLTPADAQRLRREGFLSYTFSPIRGPRTAGISNVALFETAEGAQQNLARELQPKLIRSLGPLVNVRFFSVKGIPNARGWTASLRGEPASSDVGNLYWAQGRCVLVLGNQGPGPFAGPLTTGARAIYERTNGQCP